MVYELEDNIKTDCLVVVIHMIRPDIFNFSSFKNPDRIFQEMGFFYCRPYENCTESLKNRKLSTKLYFTMQRTLSVRKMA